MEIDKSEELKEPKKEPKKRKQREFKLKYKAYYIHSKNPKISKEELIENLMLDTYLKLLDSGKI